MQKKYKRSSRKDDSSSGGGGEANNEAAASAGVRFHGNLNGNNVKTNSSTEIFEVNYSTSGGSAICSTLNSANAPRIKDPIFKSKHTSESQQNQLRQRSRSNASSRQSNEGAAAKAAGTQPGTSGAAKKSVKSVDEYEFEILSLNAQLEEHKKKEMELHRDKEKLNKLVEHYEKTNKVCTSFTKKIAI
jgi:hypothetical protein